MKILMICGSPRPQKSTSQYLLNALKERLDQKNEVLIYQAVGAKSNGEQAILENIEDTSVIVLAFPLYVDGIPGSLLRMMNNIEAQIKEHKIDCKLYVIANNGFYDARQNTIAIDMAWKWCEKCGMKKGRAIGVGAGEMVQAAPLGAGPSKNLGGVIEQLTEDISSRNSGETIFVEPNFPRFLYKMAAHSGWHRSAKKNGLKIADIKKQM